MNNPEIEIEGLPVAHRTSNNIKDAYRFDTREEAEAMMKLLGGKYEILEVPDETDTKN